MTSPSDPALLHRLKGEAQALARELGPRLEPPAGPLGRLRRRAASCRTAARNFRVNRRLARHGREDLRPLYFIWTLLHPCNFHCTYCDDHRGRKYPDLPAAGVLDTADALRLLSVMRTGTSSVYFAGGEPMLRRDLPALTRAARDLGYSPIIINTNGSVVEERLRDPAWRSWLADTDIVVVSLDALDPEVLGPMWGTKHPEKVIRNLYLLAELAPAQRVKLMVNTVIQPGKTAHARAVLELCGELGIWFCPVPMNVGPAISQDLLRDPSYQALADLIVARKKKGQRISGSARMNQRLLHAEPLHCRNTLKPHIDHDGTLFWPCKASVNVPPVPVRVLDFPDVGSLYEHARSRRDPTRFHGPGPAQCGASCNWAQNYTTDAYAYGLTHPGSLLREVVSFLRG